MDEAIHPDEPAMWERLCGAPAGSFRGRVGTVPIFEMDAPSPRPGASEEEAEAWTKQHEFYRGTEWPKGKGRCLS